MHYIIRLNSRAFNPLTKHIDEARLWEVEQAETKDSKKVIWHARNVKIGDEGIEQYIVQHKLNIRELNLELDGIAVRAGNEDAIVVLPGRHEVMG